MSNLIDTCITKRRSSLIKGTLFIVLLLVLSLFVLFSHDGTLSSKSGSKLDLKKRNGFVYPDPCYVHDSEIVCRPTLFLVGIQFAGLDILREALELHPDIDTYSTGFFNYFDNVAEVFTDVSLNFYHNIFKKSTQKIESVSPNLTICESGRLLARTYDLRVNEITGEVLPPEPFTSQVLFQLFGFNKRTIFTLIDPTVRFVREYCSRRIADDFDAYVDQSIEDYLACENNITRDNRSCVYDASLSGLLQAGLYDVLIVEDLGLTEFVPANVFAFLLNDLEDAATRNATIIQVFGFLGKEIPESSDPFWTSLDALFNRPTGCCFGQTISDAAKAKLNTFYAGRVNILGEI